MYGSIGNAFTDQFAVSVAFAIGQRKPTQAETKTVYILGYFELCFKKLISDLC